MCHGEAWYRSSTHLVSAASMMARVSAAYAIETVESSSGCIPWKRGCEMSRPSKLSTCSPLAVSTIAKCVGACRTRSGFGL